MTRVESLTAPLVQEWYECRAMEIEATSRLVDNALELTKLAIERGFDVGSHLSCRLDIKQPENSISSFYLAVLFYHHASYLSI